MCYLDCQLNSNAFRLLNFYNRMIFNQVMTFLIALEIALFVSVLIARLIALESSFY